MTSLYDPIQLGDIALPNRIVMAPLTRNRAPGQLPNALMREYYRQRANPATGAALQASLFGQASSADLTSRAYCDRTGAAG